MGGHGNFLENCIPSLTAKDHDTNVWGSRVGVVVRALAFHQCVPGSIPGPGVICGLSLLVLYSAPRGFSPGTPVFPSPQKPTFDLIWFDLFDLQSPQLVQHSCSARMIWDSNKVIIIIIYYYYYYYQLTDHHYWVQNIERNPRQCSPSKLPVYSAIKWTSELNDKLLLFRLLISSSSTSSSSALFLLLLLTHKVAAIQYFFNKWTVLISGQTLFFFPRQTRNNFT